MIAANVLHATRDLHETVSHVASLLAPGGLLLLWEHTRAERWVDLVFGLTDGWWRFADTSLRPAHPLVTSTQWHALLEAHGMPGAATVQNERPGAASPHAIICARRSLADSRRATDAGRGWLVLADRSGLAETVAAALHARGARYRVVGAGEPIGLDESADRVVDLRALDAEAPDTGDVVGVERTQVEQGRRIVPIVRALLARPSGRRARLWLITRGAQTTGADAGDRTAARGTRAQAPVWGWGRVLRLEHPDVWGGLIDLDGAPAPTDAKHIVDEILASGGPAADDQVAYRGDRRLVARLAPLRTAPSAPGPRLTPDATYLVTGGLGTVGLHVAAWLVDRGARHLVLIGRSGADVRQPVSPGTPDVTSLERRGVSVRVMTGDAGDIERMSVVLGEIEASGFPLRGLVHAAGVLTPAAIEDVDEVELAATLHPKVAGAEVLHRLTRKLPLDFFVLFSTSASLIGSKGLAHYAAANVFLDALAADRRAEGLVALSVAWGRWNVVSRMMSDAGHQWLEAEGMRAFAPERALRAMEALLACGTTLAAVVAVDDRFFARMASGTRGAFFERVTAAPAPASSVAAPRRNELTPPGAPRPGDSLERYVRDMVAHVLGLRGDEFDVEAPINTLGMDSIMALQLKNRIDADLRVSLSVVHVLGGDTTAQLAARLVEGAEGAGRPAPSSPPAVATRAPGASPDPDALSDDEVDAMLARLLTEEGRS